MSRSPTVHSICWMFGLRSSGDPALDLAAIRAEFLGLRLAQTLAERLGAVVPRPMSITADQGWEVVRDRQTEWQRLAIEPVVGQPGAPREHVGVAVWATLTSRCLSFRQFVGEICSASPDSCVTLEVNRSCCEECGTGGVAALVGMRRSAPGP
jgi:hypothetical protein